MSAEADAHDYSTGLHARDRVPQGGFSGYVVLAAANSRKAEKSRNEEEERLATLVLGTAQPLEGAGSQQSQLSS